MVKPQQNKIDKGQYWDEPLGLVQGCTHVSPGCEQCWLEATKARWEPDSEYVKNGEWSGTVRPRYDLLIRPAKKKKPTVYAVWSDLFHHDISPLFIDRAFKMMRDVPQHTFIVLTKRAERMKLLTDAYVAPPLNAFVGVSVENQEQYDRRVSILKNAIIARKVISFEPLLGPIETGDLSWLDWAIIGAESKGNAAGRPCQSEWVYDIQQNCRLQNVPVFVKQIHLQLPNRCTVLRKNLMQLWKREFPGPIPGEPR